MYETFFGLAGKPFQITPDPTFLYESEQHARALTMMEYGLASHGGITVITGEVGCGKTTLVRHLMMRLEDEFISGVVTHTQPGFQKFLKAVLLSFDLSYKARDSVELYDLFRKFVRENYDRGYRTLVIIDEAQNMDMETLESVRMLSNINVDKEDMLHMLLVGQPELLSKLRRTELRQFSQRISSSYNLEPLSAEETANYIWHRLRLVGGSEDIFPWPACAAVYKVTRGIPRLINTICETAMVFAFADERDVIDADLVREVWADKKETGLGLFETASLTQEDVTAAKSAGEEVRTKLRRSGKPDIELEHQSTAGVEADKDPGVEPDPVPAPRMKSESERARRPDTASGQSPRLYMVLNDEDAAGEDADLGDGAEAETDFTEPPTLEDRAEPQRPAAKPIEGAPLIYLRADTPHELRRLPPRPPRHISKLARLRALDQRMAANEGREPMSFPKPPDFLRPKSYPSEGGEPAGAKDTTRRQEAPQRASFFARLLKP